MKTHISQRTPHYETDWHFSHAVSTGGLIFVSGVTGVDNDAQSPADQFRCAFEALQDALRSAGASIDNMVALTSYHLDLRAHLTTFCEVKDRFVRHPYPAWTAVGAAELIAPDALVELQAIAERT